MPCVYQLLCNSCSEHAGAAHNAQHHVSQLCSELHPIESLYDTFVSHTTLVAERRVVCIHELVGECTSSNACSTTAQQHSTLDKRGMHMPLRLAFALSCCILSTTLATL
jgi:hypothetical protein